jgi:hypothetical protein
MKLTASPPSATFAISSAPEWPSVVFQTDASGSHTWHWAIAWGGFTKSGSETTTVNTWDAKPVIEDCGGTLTVRAEAADATAVITVTIVGTNPSREEVAAYVSANPAGHGFDKILEQETHFRHFTAAHEPVKSFDNGYGMCQLTTPTPTFEQVWSWKRNVDGGLALFEQKRAAAMAYLGQSHRSYTDEQLTSEAVCRWNGGAYHAWDPTGGRWVRPTNILCDSKTGNIGWDMNDPENHGKTEAQLHERDRASYAHPPGPGAHWKYRGVCYADHVLG